MPKPLEYQEKVRHGNRMFVLSLLKEGPMRFSELQDLSGMSPRGLAKNLQDLEGNELVERKLKGRWSAYGITKKGMLRISNTMTLGIVIDQIEKDNGKYFHDYSKLRPNFESKGMSWGIKDDVVIDRSLEKQISNFLFEIIKNTQSNIFEKFQDIIENIEPMKVINKKILIGFTIDCNTLLKSMKESSFMMLQESLDMSNSKLNKNIIRRPKKI